MRACAHPVAVERLARLYIGRPDNEFNWTSIATGLAIGLAVSALIFARSILASDGYLSPDSMNYLALAQNLNLGHGFMVQNEGYSPAGPAYFAIWPVGYPLAIHLLSQTTGLSVFVASKLLGALVVTCCTSMVAVAGGRLGGVLALSFAFAANLAIFSFTWSEVTFDFFLVSAAVLLAGIIGRPEKHLVVRSLLLAACCIGMFLSRYVGAFAVSFLGISALAAMWRRDLPAVVINAILCLAVIGFMWLYLRHNADVTGYATGMPRVPPLDSAGHRLAMMVRALAGSMILPVVVVDFDFQNLGPHLLDRLAVIVAVAQLIGITWLAKFILGRYRQPAREIRVDSLTLSLFLAGALYLSAIITLRWFSEFDPYDFRLLGPGLLLVEIAILRMALVSWPRAAGGITVFAAAIAASSMAFAAVPLAARAEPGYRTIVKSVERRYSEVPRGAIVVFGDEHMRYLRPDLFITEPMCRPWYDETDRWPAFLDEIDRSHPVFVDMNGHALELHGCDSSVRAALAGRHAGELFRLP
ncbi:MAG TPA: hypothetical protein VJQ77_07300 [Novosphingobium sp.]|nr:hypothetical protein [Novosphingobium sp.]